MAAQPWGEFLSSIQRLGGSLGLDEVAREALAEVADYTQELETVTASALSKFISEDPDRVPLLALCVRLSQEQLKNMLRHRLDTSSWRKLAKERPNDVIAMLEADYDIVGQIEKDRHRQWTYADILAERYASRLKASGAITRGRDLENAVEAIVTELGLPHRMRTRFAGRAGRSGPSDLAIPEGGEVAQIVVGIKGFDSTGSKLTDSTREVQEMADVRRPNQFVFVVLDGIGWKSRQSDLRTIHSLWEDGSIDGVFTTQGLQAFREAVSQAAKRVGL